MRHIQFYCSHMIQPNRKNLINLKVNKKTYRTTNIIILLLIDTFFIHILDHIKYIKQEIVKFIYKTNKFLKIIHNVNYHQ